MSLIEIIQGREILDSRGNPTVEVDVFLKDGSFGRAAVPSGASTGTREALELRDNDKKRYQGKGVLKAVEHVNTTIAHALADADALDQVAIDRKMIELDGTENKSHLGANAMLAVSMAVARAARDHLGLPLFKYLGAYKASLLPVPMCNIINGGVHSDNSLDVQEFMIVPVGAPRFSEAIRMGSEIFHTLKSILKKDGYLTAVGDEGGFAPELKTNEDALKYIVKAISEAGYTPGDDVCISVDPASSEFYNAEKGKYIFNKSTKDEFTSSQMIDYWENLIKHYPIINLEDALAESDWDGWVELTKRLGNKIQLVGDDIFVTNTKIFEKGIERHIANSILIKINQIGTLTETFEAVEMAKKASYTTVISHRSGETEDSFIADLAVALNAGQIKTGSFSRSDRIAKYNQLLRIEEQLGDTAEFLGKRAFRFFDNK